MTRKRKLEYKESFEVSSKYEAFYTGGRVQFTKSGTNVLCMCHGQLKLFEIETGKITDAFENEVEEDISTFLLADDDETLVTAGKNGIMRHWSLSTKTIKKTWKSLHKSPVSTMAFDPSITVLATGGTDSTIKVWDITRKYYTHNLKGAQGVFSKVCFHKVKSQLCVFGVADDYRIVVWDLNSSSVLSVLEGHYSTVIEIVFIDKDDTMLSCGRDKVVLMWDVSNLKLLKTIPIYEVVEACFLAPESLSLGVTLKSEDTCFITAGEKGVLKVWSTKTSQCIYSQPNSPVVLPDDSNYTGPLITQGTYVPVLNAIAVITFEQNLVLFSLEKLTFVKQFVGYNDDVLSLKFMGSEDNYLAVATNSSQIKIFQLPNFSCQLLRGHLDIVVALDVFPKNKFMLVSGSKDNCIRVWEMDSESGVVKSIYIGFGHTASVTAVACCKSKSRFFASGSEDTTLKFWDLPEKMSVPSIVPRCTVKAHDKNINSVDVSANDKLIATGSQDQTAKIWESSDLSLVGVLKGHKKGVWCVCFSPVDLAVATSSGDETIRIWSLSDLSCLKVFQGHEMTILQVSFVTEGTQLLSCAGDGIIKLWDIKSNLCIQTLGGHKEKVWAIAVSLDEESFASGAADSNIIVWKDVTKEQVTKRLAKAEEFLEQEQLLMNLVHEKKWRKALGLAITLDKPYQAYNIIKEILLEETGEQTLDRVFTNMRDDQRVSLLKFAVEWITNSKTYFAAVLVINFFYKTYDFQELLAIPNIASCIRDMLPYLDRHFKRLSRKCIDMQMLQFVSDQLNQV